MRHRAAVRAEPAGPPRSRTETKLENTQMRLARAQRELVKMTAERDALALHLWLDDRLTQAEIAERLDRADRRAGGPGVSYAAVQRALYRRRQHGDIAAAS